MDAAFREGVITQIRLFLFAGHDTTSSTICYALYLLRKHPSCLRRIRAEHDAVLGPVAHAAARLRAAPHLLHRLEYTLCVIKETLRLFPPASSSRQGARGLVLRDPVTGDSFDTEGWMVWVEHYGLGRNPDVWGPHADRFVPDRFLPEHLHRIPDGAWRPFELGPRNCIGQNLAVIEARVTLALTCRSLEFDAALDPADLEEVGRDGSFYARDEGFRKGAVHEVAGEPLYQVLIGAAKPREGMPCRVRKVDWSPLNAADSEGEGVIPTAS
jgi:cytochrome P450